MSFDYNLDRSTWHLWLNFCICHSFFLNSPLIFFFNFWYYIFLTLLLQKTTVCMDTVFCGRVHFLTSAALFNCHQQTGHACQDLSKVTCLSAWFPLLRCYLVICNVCFCYSSLVCFTQQFTSFKKLILPGFTRNGCH